jgi:hypothetical protein
LYRALLAFAHGESLAEILADDEWPRFSIVC